MIKSKSHARHLVGKTTKEDYAPEQSYTHQSRVKPPKKRKKKSQKPLSKNAQRVAEERRREMLERTKIIIKYEIK